MTKNKEPEYDDETMSDEPMFEPAAQVSLREAHDFLYTGKIAQWILFTIHLPQNQKTVITVPVSSESEVRLFKTFQRYFKTETYNWAEDMEKAIKANPELKVQAEALKKVGKQFQ